MHNRASEFGIMISSEYQGKGYGREAIQWLMEWAFNTANLHRLSLVVFEWNVNAVKLYKKLGFITEGRRRAALWREGKWWDAIDMAILQPEWEVSNGQEV